MNERAAKQRLRMEMTARRRALTRAAAKQAGWAVSRHLLGAPEFRDSRAIVVYAALRGEVPLDEVVEIALAAGKRLLLPRADSPTSLAFASASRIDGLERGRYGVREPSPRAPIEALGPGMLVLVPGVAFDERGGRLGRGGGLWDRALARADGATVCGVAFEFQVVESVPIEPHDRDMDALVTEQGIRRFAGL